MTLETIAGPLLVLLLGYMLGAIPFGLLLTRMVGAGDLRSIGSGNIGATNVLRTGRKGIAAATLLLDMAKGTAAVYVGEQLVPGTAGLAAIGALFGHLYPVWLRFRGGKGVATFFGLLLGFAFLDDALWPSPFVYAVSWLGLLALTRYSSVAGLSAALLAPVTAAVIGRFDLALLFLGFALLVFWKHRANLERLLGGTEPRVGEGKKDGGAD